MKFLFKNRRFARLHADFFGYFWIPCPLCGECFSGYEWRFNDYACIPTDEVGRGLGVCTKIECTNEAAKRRVGRYF